MSSREQTEGATRAGFLPYLVWFVILIATLFGFLSGDGLRRGEVVSITPKLVTLRFSSGQARSVDIDWDEWSGRRGSGVLCIDWSRSREFAGALESGCALRFRLMGIDSIGRHLDACLDNDGDFSEWRIWRGTPQANGMQVLARVMPVFGGSVSIQAELVPDQPSADAPRSEILMGLTLVGEHDGDWLESNEVGFYIALAASGLIVLCSALLLALSISSDRSLLGSPRKSRTCRTR